MSDVNYGPLSGGVSSLVGGLGRLIQRVRSDQAQQKAAADQLDLENTKLDAEAWVQKRINDYQNAPIDPSVNPEDYGAKWDSDVSDYLNTIEDPKKHLIARQALAQYLPVALQQQNVYGKNWTTQTLETSLTKTLRLDPSSERFQAAENQIETAPITEEQKKYLHQKLISSTLTQTVIDAANLHTDPLDLNSPLIPQAQQPVYGETPYGTQYTKGRETLPWIKKKLELADFAVKNGLVDQKAIDSFTQDVIVQRKNAATAQTKAYEGQWNDFKTRAYQSLAQGIIPAYSDMETSRGWALGGEKSNEWDALENDIRQMQKDGPDLTKKIQDQNLSALYIKLNNMKNDPSTTRAALLKVVDENQSLIGGLNIDNAHNFANSLVDDPLLRGYSDQIDAGIKSGLPASEGAKMLQQIDQARRANVPDAKIQEVLQKELAKKSASLTMAYMPQFDPTNQGNKNADINQAGSPVAQLGVIARNEDVPAFLKAVQDPVYLSKINTPDAQASLSAMTDTVGRGLDAYIQANMPNARMPWNASIFKNQNTGTFIGQTDTKNGGIYYTAQVPDSYKYATKSNSGQSFITIRPKYVETQTPGKPVFKQLVYEIWNPITKSFINLAGAY